MKKMGGPLEGPPSELIDKAIAALKSHGDLVAGVDRGS